MAPYSFHETARIEFDEAADYYDAEHRGLGLLFIDGVIGAVAQIRKFPESCAVLRGRNRSKPVHGFPYSVIYSFVDGHVRVLAVAHNRRRPFYWIGRR
ncbi:MAG: type II toxin-antitoxin system RelE/ParE family toxin [Actinomycetes bacterium]